MTDMDSEITIRDKYAPAMEITDQAEADAYFERCVRHCMTFEKTREEAEKIERANLGYYAGYYDHETRARVERLFHCAHPILGSLEQYRAPTSEEALEIGKRIGEARP